METWQLPHLAVHDDIIVLMLQEPDCLWTYWETDREMMSCLLGDQESECLPGPLTLRLYQSDAPGGTGKVETLDIKVGQLQGSWYIKLSKPSMYYWIDLGLMLRERFVTLLRSSVVSLYGDSVGLTLAYKLLPDAQQAAPVNNGEGGEDLPSSTEYYQRS